MKERRDKNMGGFQKHSTLTREKRSQLETAAQVSVFARLSAYRMASLLLAVLRRARIAEWSRVSYAMRDPEANAGILFQMSIRKWMRLDRAVQITEALVECLRPMQYPTSPRYGEEEEEPYSEAV